MADSYVQFTADSTGKKVRMFQNTIGGNTVEAMAITSITPTGYTNSYVQVIDQTGKKMQYFQNTVGSNTAVALAVVLVDSSGSPVI